MSDDEPVEVAQRINPIRLIQPLLESINVAPSHYKAAQLVARLYANLVSLRGIDQDFDAEWAAIDGERFLRLVNHRTRWIRLTPRLVQGAHEALLVLMERHGMGFQAALQDPIEVEAARAQQDFDARRARLRRRSSPSP
jgi:hypothetical protein